MQFENIVFWKGGVELEGGVKGVRFQDCHFGGIGDYAIRALGPSVIDVAIRDCLFHDCAGGITADFAGCDAWLICNCNSWRNSDCDLVLGSTGVVAEHCGFEIRQGSLSRSFVHISGGGHTLSQCRFGNEVDGYGEPPMNIVVVSPLGGGTTGTLTDIEIVGCKSLGRVGGPTAASAKHAIAFNKQPNECRIAGNRFSQHYGDAGGYIPCCDSAYLDATARADYWTGNRSYLWGSLPTTPEEWGIEERDWLIE